MYISKKAYWLIYIMICATILLPMLALGLKDRTSLTPLLVTGGLVESLPALIYLLTTALSAVVSVRERRFLPWGLYSFVCFFLAGEEAAWGRESILGWQMLSNSGSTQSKDIHNLATDLLAQNTSSMVIFVAVVFVMVLAISFVVSQKATPEGWLRCLGVRDLSQKFIITGIFLLLFGFIDILPIFGFPYLPGQWSLEESCELLGSIALLFAVIVKLLDSSLIEK